MMKFKRIIALTILAALAATIAAYAQRQRPTLQEAQEAMRRHREKTRGTVTARQAVFGVLHGQGAPGGLVIFPQCGEETRLTTPVGESLQERLDSFVAAAPQYGWQSENGVINVVPKGGIPPLLNIRVARFRAQNVRTPDEALANLLETPEMSEAMGRPNVGWRLLRGRLGYYGPNPDTSGGGKVFSVNCDGVTVREALNAIAREHGSTMWTYRGNNCHGVNSFELNFSTWNTH